MIWQISWYFGTKKDIILEILEEALKLNREGHSVLINALIGKSNFREGSIDTE